MLDRIVFRFMGRVMSPSNFQPDPVRQHLQRSFKHVAIGGIAADAVTQPEPAPTPAKFILDKSGMTRAYDLRSSAETKF